MKNQIRHQHLTKLIQGLEGHQCLLREGHLHHLVEVCQLLEVVVNLHLRVGVHPLPWVEELLHHQVGLLQHHLVEVNQHHLVEVHRHHQVEVHRHHLVGALQLHLVEGLVADHLFHKQAEGLPLVEGSQVK